MAAKSSYLEKYCKAVLSGKITACSRIKQVCERLLHDIKNPGVWHFDPAVSGRHIAFIERFCRTPSGKLGAPLVLELYQKAWLDAIFGFVDDKGVRRFNECLIVCGRKTVKQACCPPR